MSEIISDLSEEENCRRSKSGCLSDIAEHYCKTLFIAHWLLHFLLHSIEWFLHDLLKLSKISFQEDTLPEFHSHCLLLTAGQGTELTSFTCVILGCYKHTLLSIKNTIIHEVPHLLGTYWRWGHHLWSCDSWDVGAAWHFIGQVKIWQYGTVMTYMGEVAEVSAASLEDESEAINQQGK